MRRLLPLVVLLAALAAAPAGAQDGTRRALLIGVDQYESSPAREFADLRGTINDVRLMRDVLEERGFAEIDTLLGTDATRQNILDAIRGWIGRAQSGDDLVFYFSGHGSTADTTFAGEDGLETIVPHDVEAGDIVDKELRQLWNAALDRVGPEGTLAVIQDNCHSGSGERGECTPRVATPARRIVLPGGAIGPPPSERGALVLSASQDWQPAREGRIEGEVRGAFTWSLVRALRATPPGAPAGRVFERTRAVLAGLIPAQQPAISGPTDRPLFGEDPGPGGGFGIGVVEVAGDRVVLQGGRFMGLNPGAELERFRTEGADDAPVRLRVVEPGTWGDPCGVETEADGVARSCAEVAEGDLARVVPGDLFEITKAVADVPPVTFWVPPAVADLAAVQAEAAACPTGAPCTDVPAPGVAAAVAGNRQLAALGADAPGAATVYRPLPPTVGLRARVVAGLGELADVAIEDRPEAADYWLAGALDADGTPRYRWVRSEVALGGDTLSAFPVHGAPYALGATPGAPDSLAAVAARIARSTEWLRRASPPTEAFPVRVLGLQRISGGPVLVPDSTTGVLTIPPSDIPPGPFRCDDHPTECYRFVLGLTDEDRAAYAQKNYCLLYTSDAADE